MEPEDATVQSGESVRFVCEVAGDPEPVVVSNLALDIRVSIKLEDPGGCHQAKKQSPVRMPFDSRSARKVDSSDSF